MQFSQRMHPLWASTATLSPILNSSTVSPTATTVPTYSWPGMNTPKGGWPGNGWEVILRSVPQMAHAATLMSTCCGPGLGTGRCITLRSLGPTSTAALIVSGICCVCIWVPPDVSLTTWACPLARSRPSQWECPRGEGEELVLLSVGLYLVGQVGDLGVLVVDDRGHIRASHRLGKRTNGFQVVCPLLALGHLQEGSLHLVHDRFGSPLGHGDPSPLLQEQVVPLLLECGDIAERLDPVVAGNAEHADCLAFVGRQDLCRAVNAGIDVAADQVGHGEAGAKGDVGEGLS